MMKKHSLGENSFDFVKAFWYYSNGQYLIITTYLGMKQSKNGSFSKKKTVEIVYHSEETM